MSHLNKYKQVNLYYDLKSYRILFVYKLFGKKKFYLYYNLLLNK